MTLLTVNGEIRVNGEPVCPKGTPVTEAKRLMKERILQICPDYTDIDIIDGEGFKDFRPSVKQPKPA